MNFLPDNYKITSTGGNYCKFKKGDTKIRVMSSATVGFEYWNTDGKPVRSKEFPETLPDDIRYNDEGKPEQVKEFWAFTVWNYNENKMQICEITQKSIMEAIQGYVNEPAWGDPKQYDFKITRTGDGFDTKYQVQALPKSDLPEEAANAFVAMPVNLEALFRGEDPFNSQAAPEKTGEETIDLNKMNL